MKKVLVLLGMLTLMVFSLSGCSSPAPESETQQPATENTMESTQPGSQESGAAGETAQPQTEEQQQSSGEATQ